MKLKETFSAAVLMKTSEPLQIINNICMPTPKKGQVLVKIRYAGLCHSQLMEIKGARGEDKYLPHMLGHEGVGQVVAIGEGVSKVNLEDTVVLSWIKGEGIDAGGAQYQTTDGLIINSGAITAFSEYALVSENRLLLKPAGTPDKLSVLYGCALPTGFGMVVNNLPEQATGHIGFLGLGGIGISALLAAKLYDFSQVIVIDVNPDKLALAKTLGATHAINARDPDFIEQIYQLTDGVGLDYCFESAGKAETIEKAYALTRRQGGLCIFASHPPHGDKIQLDPFDLICGKNIRGTWGGETQPERDIKQFSGLYDKGQLPLDALISQSYRLDEINEAVNDLTQQNIVRALIDCHPEEAVC
ncbi:MAG: zinc-binding dehydrogenase [Legionella sp.]|nr:zinc-binding dehydrogenase [Legionella sp.]